MPKTAKQLREDDPFLEVESLETGDLNHLHVWLLAQLRCSDYGTDGPMHTALRIALENVRREQQRRGHQLTLT